MLQYIYSLWCFCLGEAWAKTPQNLFLENVRFMTTKVTLPQRLKSTLQAYPRQFWLLFTGMLISTIGSSMIWPFLMIYVTEKLGLSLSVSTSLNTINALAGLGSVFLVGHLVDRMGRKWAMVISLILNGLVYLLQAQANSYLGFAFVMGLSGAVNPLYRVAADAMMADLLPKEKRIGGYSLMRMSNNIGISIGPAIGGFINTGSYGLAFYIAAGGMIFFGLLMLLFAHETMPEASADPETRTQEQGPGGYGTVLRDRHFLSFVGLFTLVQFCAATVWILLSVYAKHQYGVLENLYGWIPTTNALMVVLFQIAVTAFTRRFSPLPVMAAGALFYAIATTSVGVGQGFWAFEASMVVMTIGELILMPTASTYIANLAPADMRGRYMSFFSLSWGAASGLAPLIGGNLGDRLGPQVTWFAAGLVGVAAMLGFLGLQARRKRAFQERKLET
jgi:MFS family permease